MKLAVVGGRGVSNREHVFRILDTFWNANDEYDTIVTGCATGVDSFAKKYAESRDIPYIEYEADWDLYGKSAGPIRNKEIVGGSNGVLAILDVNGYNKGTMNTVQHAWYMKKPVYAEFSN